MDREGEIDRYRWIGNEKRDREKWWEKEKDRLRQRELDLLSLEWERQGKRYTKEKDIISL